MSITVTNYTDFKALFSGCGFGVVAYHDGGGTDFQITAIATGGVVIRAVSMGSKPGTFNTDFPLAISLSIDPSAT